MTSRVLLLPFVFAPSVLAGCGTEEPPIEPWARRFGPESAPTRASLAVDARGGVVVTGSFTGKIDLGGGPVEATSGDEDAFVLALDKHGETLWGGTTGTYGQQRCMAAGIGPDGAVDIMGSFNQKVDFGSGALTTNGVDAFVSSFDADGDSLWSRQSTGGGANLNGADVDRAGDVLVGGDFYGTLDLGGDEPFNDEAYLGFIAKLGATGEHLWSRTLGGYGNGVSVVAASPTGEVIIGGYNYLEVSLGAQVFESNGDGEAAFIGKIGPGGDGRWLFQLGGGAAEVHAIAVDAEGAVIVAGSFDSHIEAGADQADTSTGEAAFILKLAPDGAVRWLRGFGDQQVRIDAIAAGPGGEIAFTGFYIGEADFGGGPLAPRNPEAFFLASLDASGGHLASAGYGSSTYASEGLGLRFAPDGALLVTGSFHGPLNLGGLETQDTVDLFVARVASITSP